MKIPSSGNKSHNEKPLELLSNGHFEKYNSKVFGRENALLIMHINMRACF